MQQDLSDRQLATLIRHLARAHLEIERGLRDPDQLRGWIAPAAYLRLRQPDRPRFPRGGPVTPQDLGTVRLTRLADHHVYATVPTRETGDRWGAILLELAHAPARHDQRWWATGIERLRQPPTPDLPLPAEPDEASPPHTEAPRPADPVELLLGARPGGEHGQRLWDAAREEIRRYRDHRGLTGFDHGILGPLPDDPGAREERDRLHQLLRLLGPLLDREQTRDPATRDRSPELER